MYTELQLVAKKNNVLRREKRDNDDEMKQKIMERLGTVRCPPVISEIFYLTKILDLTSD